MGVFNLIYHNHIVKIYLSELFKSNLLTLINNQIEKKIYAVSFDTERTTKIIQKKAALI